VSNNLSSQSHRSLLLWLLLVSTVAHNYQRRMSFTIKDFKGDDARSNREYRVEWRPALLAETRGHANPVHEFGLLGIALGAAEYATYDPNPFVRRPAPINPGPAAPAAQWSNYRDLKDDYEKQQRAEALASTAIINHLGDTPRELLREPITRSYHRRSSSKHSTTIICLSHARN
jgi:hypothetical protein